jgi:hypothetical protein
LINKDVNEVSEGSFTRAFGIGDGGAVLGRPDGFIAARWEAMVSPPEELSIIFNRVAHTA